MDDDGIGSRTMVKPYQAPTTKWQPYRHLVMLTAVLQFCFAANSLSLSKPSLSFVCTYHATCPKRHYPKCDCRRLQQKSSKLSHYSTALRETASSLEDGNDANSSPSLLSNFLKCDLSVPTVLLAAFLNLLGFTMTQPIQPALGKHFSLPLGASYGSLLSAYPLGMLFGVFLWPTLSDVLGRKIVMSLTLMGSGLGLMLQSWGITRFWTLEQFLYAKVLTGFFSGNSPISKAFLADKGSAGNKGDLTKYLAWKDAASTLAFILGPALGGFAYHFFGKNTVGDNSNQISCVIFCSALASLFASFSVMMFVKSNEPTDSISKANGTISNRESTSNSSANADSKAKRENKGSNTEIISCPLGTKLWTGVVTVACVTALYHVADSTFFAFFPVLLQNQLNFDTQAVGLAFTASAIVSFTISAFISSRFLQAFGPVAACTTGLGAVGVGLMTLGHAASLPTGVNLGVTAALVLVASTFYYTGVPLYGPSIPTMLMQCVPRHRRGAVMGFDGAVNTIARVLSPLIMGEIHRVKGAGTSFKLAGSCVYAALSIALFRRWLVLRNIFGKTESAVET